jgi:hypothetical protein
LIPSEGIRTALGGSSSGVFSNSKVVWTELEKAGAETGDRVWRMPLWEYYANKVTCKITFYNYSLISLIICILKMATFLFFFWLC